MHLLHFLSRDLLLQLLQKANSHWDAEERYVADVTCTLSVIGFVVGVDVVVPLELIERADPARVEVLCCFRTDAVYG